LSGTVKKLVFRRRKVRTTKGSRTKCGYCWLVTAIQRHVKVKCEANPTIPPFETTLKNEKEFHMAGTFRGTRHFAISGTSNTGSARSASYVFTRTNRMALAHASLLCGVGVIRVPENRVLLLQSAMTRFTARIFRIEPRLPERGVEGLEAV